MYALGGLCSGDLAVDIDNMEYTVSITNSVWYTGDVYQNTLIKQSFSTLLQWSLLQIPDIQCFTHRTLIDFIMLVCFVLLATIADLKAPVPVNSFHFANTLVCTVCLSLCRTTAYNYWRQGSWNYLYLVTNGKEDL